MVAALCSCSTSSEFLSAIAAAKDSVPASSSSARPYSLSLMREPSTSTAIRSAPASSGTTSSAPGPTSEATRDVVGPAGGAAGGEGLIECGLVDRGGAEAVVERAEDLGGVDLALGPVEAGPPGEEDLGHEIEDELLGLFGRVHRREQPGHLPERPELKDRVIESGLPLEQNAPQLEHDAQPQRERHRHGPHVACHRFVGVDDDFRLAASQASHLLRFLEPLGRADARQRLGGGDEREPDRLALEPPNQRHPTALEELAFRPGQTAGGRKRTGKGKERAGGR